jgi:uncharacterized membrane protein
MPEPDETVITNRAKAKKHEKESSKEKPKAKKRPEQAKPGAEPAEAMPPKSVVIAKIAALENAVKRLKSLSLLLLFLILGLGGGMIALNEKKPSESVAVPLNKAVDPFSTPFHSGDETGDMKTLLKEVSTELEQQKARNRLTKLADEAISTGSRYAFRELERYYDDPNNSFMKDACNAEIIRVESHYITVRRYRTYAVPLAKLFPGKRESELTYDDLALLLASEANHWELRAWAAQQMGDMRDDAEVPEALVRAMKGESDLCVVQEALRSFEKLTGYQPPGVFNTTVAVAWWGENKERFAKAGRTPAK